MLRVGMALISVSDKAGIEEFARRLHGRGVELLATGGTALALERTGIPIMRIESITDTPELLGGRVKTLHPRIFAGILASRDNPIHIAVLEDLGIGLIDMVVVNLYPFERAVEAGKPREEVLENIDIGGVSLIRAAAKNHGQVASVTSPDQYGPVMAEIERSGGLSDDTLAALATAAFDRTMRYDGAIHAYLSGAPAGAAADGGAVLALALRKVRDLRYGENPHQKGALYGWRGGPSPADAELLKGMEMSYNNYLDIHAGARIVSEFDGPAAAIIKHTNPCGVAVADSAMKAYRRAFESDKIAAFGGIVALNREVDQRTASEIIKVFTEVVVAPSFSSSALDVLAERKSLRTVRWTTMLDMERGGPELTSLGTAFLWQETAPVGEDRWTVPTERNPTSEEWSDLRFAWKVVSHVKSNAIVVAKDGRTMGIGAGHQSRVGAVTVAVEQAGRRAKDAVLASDGFFPFPDSIETAANAGISAIVQPGGSIKDRQIVRAADDHGMAMVITNTRAFLH